MRSNSILKTQLTVLFICLSAFVGVAQTFTVDGVNYEVTSTNPNEVATVDASNAEVITVPENVVDNNVTYTVTAIGNFTFDGNSLSSVNLPNTIRSIGIRAFQLTNNLTSIVIPSSVTNIGQNAFRGGGASSLTTVIVEAVIPPDIDTREDSHTFNTRANINLTIPVGSEAAYETAGWTGFNSVNGVLNVQVGSTFTVDNLNYKITSLTPNEVALTGGTSATSSLVIPENVTTSDTTFSVTSVGDAAFKDALLTAVTFPETIISIEEEAFRNNQLTNLTLPSTVTSIGAGAFEANDITILTLLEGLVTIGDNAFQSNQLQSLSLPASLTSIGNNAFLNNLLTNLTLSEGLVSIGNDAFRNNQLTNLTLPSTVTSIDQRAFEANDLTSLTLSQSLITLGNNVFANNQLTSLNLPASLTSIGNAAFLNNLITNLTLSEGLVTIGNDAFRNNQLTSLTIPATVTSVGSRAFVNNPLTIINSQATTPPTITTGANDTFSNRGVIDLTIPPGTEAAYEAATWTGFNSVNGVFEVGSTFTDNNLNYEVTAVTPNEVELKGGTPSTTSLAIPENVTNGGTTFTVTSVGFEAFKDALLTAVTFPETVIAIKEEAFLNNLFTNITLSDNLTSLEAGAFQSNQLESLNLPVSLTSIGNNAFLNNSITNLTLSEGLETIGNDAFRNNELTNLTLPSTVTNVGSRAFDNNPLMAINSLATTPPTITTGTDDSFGNRGAIDLTIPPETEAAYQAATWTGFNSVNGVINFQVGATFTDNNLNFKVTSLTPNELEITGGTPATTSLAIPENVTNGGTTFTVTSVGFEAFRESGLTSLIMPNTIRSIGTSSFQQNQLSNLVLSNGIISIGNGAFNSNVLQGNLIIPSSVVNVGRFAFFENQLESLSLLEGIETIGDSAFKNNDLTNLILPSSIASIGSEAFKGNSLTAISSLASTPPSITTGNLDAFSDREDINLTIPSGTTSAYEAAEWTGFASTSEFDFDFEQDGLFYKIVSTNPNEVEIVTGAPPRDFEIPETVSDEGINFTVTSIGNRAFEFANIVNLIIPASIDNIESLAFNANGSMRTVSLLNPNPPFLQLSGFSNRRNIQLTVPEASLDSYLNNNQWNSSTNDNDPQSAEDSRRFFSINSVYTSTIGRGGISSNLIFRNINRNQAVNKILIRSKNTGSLPSDFVIPDNFIIRGINFIITEIDANALDNEGLVNVTLPSGLESIGSFAFGDNPLETITTTNSSPAFIQVSSFGDRSNTDLFVPAGTTQAYVDAGWTGFRSINELAITVNLKVFLQGAAINPIVGEEGLMRDSLRENGLLPTTSPYGDGATVSPTVFTTTGANAIVDWVLVELRSGDDNENTTFVNSTSALLQRDGDIVGLDGTSSITFTEDEGDYFIAIKHRNHIGILAAVPAPLSGTANTVDFTQEVTAAKGENLALTQVNGTFAMIAGDADGSSQILNTDITEGLTLAGGGESYANADADMNGFVLNSDIQLLILGNSGTVQQFD